MWNPKVTVAARSSAFNGGRDQPRSLVESTSDSPETAVMKSHMHNDPGAFFPFIPIRRSLLPVQRAQLYYERIQRHVLLRQGVLQPQRGQQASPCKEATSEVLPEIHVRALPTWRAMRWRGAVERSAPASTDPSNNNSYGLLQVWVYDVQGRVR